MPRAVVTTGWWSAAIVAAAGWLAALPLAATDPHLDPTRVLAGCSACHRGHGVTGSPMLPASQKELCLSCHESQAAVHARVREGALSPNAAPPLLSDVLSMPFVHPITPEAYSRREPGAVTCSSCHSPHRAMVDSGAAGSGRRLSTRDGSRFEFELCQSCHGSAGIGTEDLLDVSRLFNPNNRSYHPVEGPASDASPSLRIDAAGTQIDCTDCHGNSDPAGPSGPHGSWVQSILRLEYLPSDGREESEEAYALCYGCHDRDRVLDDSPFPLHRSHVVDLRASCATCHSAHGSVENRALIRFGEETIGGGVGPSLAGGRLAFLSDAPGSGTCYLTCHGVDHGPESYGAVSLPEGRSVPDLDERGAAPASRRAVRPASRPAARKPSRPDR